MALGDLFRVSFRYNVCEQPVTITLGFEHIQAGGAEEFNLCSLLAANVAAEMSSLRASLSEQCSFEGAVARKLTGAAQPPGRNSLIGISGQLNTSSIPASKCLMVVHRQQTRGVRSNGKSYVSGLAEADVNGNVVNDNAIIVAIQDIFDDLLQFEVGVTGATATFRMVVLSRENGASGAWQGWPVTSNRISNRLLNQRRRQTREFGFSADNALQ